MEKHKHVRIVRGRKGKGQTGTVFWIGPNNYDGGERCGIHADNGETYWVKTEYLEAIDNTEAALNETGEEARGKKVEKGSLVRWSEDGKTGTGFVFWTGESKSGYNRIGINDNGSGEMMWLFGNQVRSLTTTEAEELLAKDKKSPRKTYRSTPPENELSGTPTNDGGKPDAPTLMSDGEQPDDEVPDSQHPSRLPTHLDDTHSTIHLEEMALFDLVGAAKKVPYRVFAECEHRLQQGGPSSRLKLTANAVAGTIEAKLLAPDSPDEIIDACMEFVAEFGVQLFIEDEPKEGISQAIGILKESLMAFEPSFKGEKDR